MKVFISSVITGMEPYRDAADAGAQALRNDVIRAEQFGASSGSPQQACLAGVRDAEATLLLLGGRYGALQQSGVSATEEEYLEARARHPVLVFVQSGVEREDEQKAFLTRVRDWAQGVYTADFSSPEDLKAAVTTALHDLELSQATGPADVEALQRQAEELHPTSRRTNQVRLSISVVGRPTQQVLRPAELEAPELADRVSQEAMFGTHRIFDRAEGIDSRIDGDALVLEQPSSSILLSEIGSVRITLSIREPGLLGAIIEEDVTAAVERGLRFAGWVLDDLDGARRLDTVAVSLALLDASATMWRTRSEHAESPSSGTMSMVPDSLVVGITPPTRPRPALTNDAHQIAEDLMVRLRREYRSH